MDILLWSTWKNAIEFNCGVNFDVFSPLCEEGDFEVVTTSLWKNIEHAQLLDEYYFSRYYFDYLYLFAAAKEGIIWSKTVLISKEEK